MASKDDNKRKYSVDNTEEEAPLKKQKMIGGDNNGDDHGNDGDDNDDDHDDEGDDDGDSSFSSTNDDYSSEPEEEVYLKEGINIPTGSEEKLLI
jgi:hypothetical protein